MTNRCDKITPDVAIQVVGGRDVRPDQSDGTHKEDVKYESEHPEIFKGN